MPVDEQVFHLIQDDALIAKIHTEELPADEYYDLLGPVLQRKFPGADPTLVEHVVALTAAFDAATSFALSFGIAKFQLGQTKVKLVGEYVGREGRSPNPDLVESIRNWPPINDQAVTELPGNDQLCETAHGTSLYSGSTPSSAVIDTEGIVAHGCFPAQGHRGPQEVDLGGSRLSSA